MDRIELFALDQLDSVGVIIIESGLIKFANKCFSDLFNCGIEFINGQHISDLFGSLYNTKDASFVQVILEHLELRRHGSCTLRDISNKNLYQVKISIFSATSLCCYFTKLCTDDGDATKKRRSSSFPPSVDIANSNELKSHSDLSDVVVSIAKVRSAVLEYEPNHEDFKILYISKPLLEFTRRPMEEVVGQLMKKGKVASDACLDAWFSQLIPKGEISYEDRTTITPCVNSKGERVVFQYRTRMLGHSANNNPIIAIVIEDITEKTKLDEELFRRQQAVEETLQSQQMMNILCDHSSAYMGVAEITPDYKDYVFLYANPATMAMFNTYQRSGFRASSGLPQETVEVNIRQVLESKMTGGPIYYERDYTSHGVSAWYFTCVKYVKDNIFTFSSQEITPTKALEEELRKNALQLEEKVRARTMELQQALAVKSRFLAIMSHEIRTPLSGIIGSMNLLAETQLNNDQQELLHTAQVCGDQLLYLINDILDFAKMDEQKMQLELRNISVRDFLEESLEIVSIGAEAKGIELLCKVDPNVPTNIVGDSARLRQICVNLLSNSIKFSSKGNIILAAQLISRDPQTATIQFSVTDYGIGIPDEFKANIFQPFVQADVSVSRRFGGTGLGLTISKRLAELHNGTMWFESEAGKGSTFYFTVCLPVPINLDNAPPMQFLANKRIGLLEENAQLAEILKDMITSWDLGVEVFQSADELIKTASSFNLLIIEAAQANKEFVDAMSKINIEMIAIGHKALSDRVVFLKKPIRAYNLKKLLYQHVGKRLSIEYLSHMSCQSSSSSVVMGEASEMPDINFNIKILLAEDNVTNQSIIKRMLKTIGYCNLTIVDDGQKAVEAVKNNHFDVVLMDCMMPIMSGQEATQVIRTTLPKQNQPIIIALTADAFLENEERCLAIGMNCFLQKPIDKKKLEQVLHEYSIVTTIN